VDVPMAHPVCFHLTLSFFTFPPLSSFDTHSYTHAHTHTYTHTHAHTHTHHPATLLTYACTWSLNHLQIWRLIAKRLNLESSFPVRLVASDAAQRQHDLGIVIYQFKINFTPRLGALSTPSPPSPSCITSIHTHFYTLAGATQTHTHTHTHALPVQWVRYRWATKRSFGPLLMV
jgi:hypothetical protein